MSAESNADVINIHNKAEIDFWCSQWGCTAAELKAAVVIVGSAVKEVELFFRQKGQL